jgi:NADPH:quinone reductase-like Zn-dependent oxidoreductase
MPLAYGFAEYGGPDTQQFLDPDLPEPGPGQLVVAVHAAGVNPADWKVRAGTRKDTVPVTLPAVLGREVSGVVTAVGDRVDGFTIGDAVFGATATGFGGYAEYTLLNAHSTALKPQQVSFADAATVPVAVGTAFDIIDSLAVSDVDTVLVIGAGGGVGSAATQLARARGATVLGVASAGKRDLVEANGGIWIEAGDDATARISGVTAIVDLVGGTTLRMLAGAAPDARIVSVADPAGAAELGGSGVERRRTTEVFATVAALIADGTVNPHVEQTFPLSEAGAALAVVEGGHARGKVVIAVR